MLDLCVVFTVRLYLSVWEDTGARDMCGFVICTCLGVLVLYVGDRVSVHGGHVTPRQYGLRARVSALIRLGLPLCQLVQDRHAIICMQYRFLRFFGISYNARSFYGRSCMPTWVLFLEYFVCYLCSCLFFMRSCSFALCDFFGISLPSPPPSLGMAICKSGTRIGFILILVC